MPRPPASPRSAVVRAASAGAAALLLGGCAGALDPAGPVAMSQRWLFLLALAIATIVIVAVTWFTVHALRTDTPLADGNRFVLVWGMAVPTAILLVVMGVAFAVLADEPREGDLTIEVIGHQYWWEVRYPDSGVITANEIHMPTGVPVRFVLTTQDVLHSVWVPELGGKMDMVPGRVNEIVLQADEPGRHLGHCTEFCGLQHAKMKFHVEAESPEEFDAWLAAQAEPATFASAEAEQAFTENSCAACHTVRGTSADGDLGPDLTHLASRAFFGAGILETTRENLAPFVLDAQAEKSGSLMPALPHAQEDLDVLLDQLLAWE